MAAWNLERLGVRERVGLWIAAVFVLVLVGDRLVLRPVLAVQQELGVRIRDAEELLAKTGQIVTQRERVAEAYDEVAGLLPEGSPSAAVDLVALKGEIDDLARRTGVSLVSMEDREREGTAYSREYAVTVGKFEADVESLLQFLYALQQSPGMLRAQRLAVSPKRDSARLEGSMVITKVVSRPGEVRRAAATAAVQPTS